MPLTDAKIKNTKVGSKPFKLYDRDGLFLLVNPSGSKLWRFKFRLNKVEGVCSLGKYPNVSLKDARLLAAEKRKMVEAGLHPNKVNKQTDEYTFGDALKDYLGTKKSLSQRYMKLLKSKSDRLILPLIGDLSIGSVEPFHIKALLDNCSANNGKTQAVSVLSVINSVFSYAVQSLKATHNPASAFRGYVKPNPTSHANALKQSDLKELFIRLRQSGIHQSLKNLIRFLIYTGVRGHEGRLMEWSEIDFQTGVWNIPAEKLKKRRPHIVPLTRQCLDILNAQKSGSNQYVFWLDNHPCPLIGSVNNALNVLKLPHITAHDFRATMATGLTEMGYGMDLVKTQLAHSKASGTDAAYFHAVHLDERRAMLQAWADYIDSLTEG